MRPREIAAEMSEAMKAAARKVWSERAKEIPPEDREETAKLCKRHVLNSLEREWG